MSKATADIDRTIFNKNDQRTEDLHLQLSAKYMVYKDLADRVILNPTQMEKNDHRVFYIRPDTIFTAEPRLQNQYRNEFIRQVSSPPQPEPFTLMADDFYKQMLDSISDQSDPKDVRDRICNFYKKQQFRLQHKKHKYLSRWSHFALTSETVDRVSLTFQPQYSKVQFELESAVKRYQRLEGDDHFDYEPRPQRIEPNGLINQDDLNVESLKKHCTLRVDDLDVYNRIVCYEDRCNKHADKFINRAKWVPLSHRFDIYVQGQERVQALRQDAIKKQKTWQRRLQVKGQLLIDLKKMGERGAKELNQIEQTLTFVKQEQKVRSVRDPYIQTASYNQELPPMIIWNQVDMKLQLEDLCNEFKITGDMEIDEGNSFSYAVVVQFPTLFFNQMIKTQFAPYDAVPQILNPTELGRKDIQDIIESNMKKYGKGAPGSTLLEQIEIQRQCEAMKIQYINQVEKSLFGEFNNGQLEDFPKVRLKKAHWLPYVCFKAELSKEQMQQAALLNGDHNPLDRIAAHFVELVNVNDISSVNLTLESLSQIHYDKLKTGKLRQEFFNLDHSNTESIFTEGQKEFMIHFMHCIKLKRQLGYKPNTLQDEELPKNSLYDTQQHLLFAEYLMVCLKTRQHKTKLLYILNAFRSIQKRITLELRELATRDRVSFECNIVEPKEKTDGGVRLNSDDMDERRVEAHVESIVMDEMIDINRYKFQDQLQNSMWSTCPILPKYHITFGEPVERQEVSVENEVNKNKDPRHSQASRLLGRIDFIKEHLDQTVLVQDDYGVNVMYDCAFADMRALEQEMLKIMSYYVNKLEPMQETDLRNVFPSVDRFNLVKEIVICEENYHRAKLELAFQYLECYEHCCDSLECQRLIQIIVDLMSRRPRINLAANHFLDSYATEVKVLETQTKLIKEFIKMQMENELQVNQDVRECLEKSYRLIYEQLENKWQYFESSEVQDEKDRRKLTKLGVQNNVDAHIAKKLEYARPGMFNAKHPQVQVAQFAEMLGVPVSNLHMLLKEHHERDPLVKQAIHENVSFIKLQEGYPTFYSKTEVRKENIVQVAPGCNKIGILEIYESLASVVKVSAACHHAVREILDCHEPDNGLVASMYELLTLEFMLAELRAVKSEYHGSQIVSSKDLDVIEDQSVVGNSEKMYFLIKELTASHEDSSLIKNPTIFTKMDMRSMLDYNFDEAQDSQNFVKKKLSMLQKMATDMQPENKKQITKTKSEVRKEKKKEDLDTVEALEKMLDDPEDSLSDQDEQINKIGGAQQGKDMKFARFRKVQSRPNVPSMLVSFCSAVELMRLRHLLVEAYYQRQALVSIYCQQCHRMGKEPKVFFKDAFNFETHLSGGENWTNFIDQGPSEENFVSLELAIKEFDPTLTSCINFADPEAFKALICPLGLEELRIVVRYELVNLQTLITGVRHNQILMDNCLRQIAELELFEKGFLVSAPVNDIKGKLKDQNLFENNLKRLPETEKRKVTQKLQEKVSKCAYSVIARKNRPKEQVENAYKKIRQTVVDKRFEKVELGLRYLRTARIMLAHDYCTDIESSLFLDAMRIELLNETTQIRKRAYLLPKEAMVHRLPVPRYGEHSYAAYADDEPEGIQDWEFYDSQKKQITDFWKIPTFYECSTINLQLETFQAQNLKKLYQYNLATAEDASQSCLFDENQKLQLKYFHSKLDELSLEETESSVQKFGRFADYRQAPQCTQLLVFKYLHYFRQLNNLFDLEYFKNKLATRATSIATLEQSVMSGLPFWEAKHTELNDDEESSGDQQVPYSKQDDAFRNKLAEQVIAKIQIEKKHKLQLIADLDGIKDVFNAWSAKMTKQHLQGSLEQAAQFLNELVQVSFSNTLLSLQSVRDWQIKTGDTQKEIQSINSLLNLFSHIDDNKVTYTNGYHVNLATTSMSRISLDYNAHRIDFRNFFLASQPVIDEQGLNPIEHTLVQGMYTTNSLQIKQYRRLRPYLGWLPPRDFHYLDYKLLNITKDMRKYIGANVTQNQETSLKYAHQKLRIEANHYQANFSTQLEVFSEQKQFIRMQIKSYKLQTVLIILMTKNLLPNDMEQLKALSAEFNDLFSWKVMSQHDEIAKQKQGAVKVQPSDPVKQIQKSIAQPQQNEQAQSLISLFDMYTCEVDVYQREISNHMILTGTRMIERETQSLAKAFESNGKRLEVLIDIHQQFAATFDSTEDKRNHLDIVNKVAPVQKMLTAIKNRMLVIKTLTGGEGIIIRTKDLNSILEDFCRSIIKNGEIEMRTRCEQLSLQIIQYENLLYSKDQQLFNMEHKLKYAKDELSKIINTKVFSKGNTLIYELDHSNRQLRLVKDNVYDMEQKLKDKIRLSFDKDLEQARLELAETRKKFDEYQKTLNSHMKADIQRNINELDVQLKRLVQRKDTPIDHTAKKTSAQLVDEYSHLLAGEAKKEYKEAQLSGVTSEKSRLFNNKDMEMIFREMERLKMSEKDAREELLEMENLLRKQRMMQNFKWLAAQRRWDEKVDNLKQQLNSNTTLWEQLAEAEKREQVLKQELQRTQEDVASQDKVLERIKDELKYEQLEKHKLVNFKETKLKRLNQLEDMSKQMELMQSIDLDKVLGSMGQKERLLEQLKAETRDGAEVIAQIYRSKNREVERTREYARNESKVKDLAMQKMEALRAEIQLLQSGDLTSMNLWKDKVQKLKDQKSEILSQISSTQFEQAQKQQQQFMNSTSGSITLSPDATNNIHQSLGMFGTQKRKNQKILPQLSVRGPLQKKKHHNIFDQLVSHSQTITGHQHKEAMSARHTNHREDSLLQGSLISNVSKQQMSSIDAENLFVSLQPQIPSMQLSKNDTMSNGRNQASKAISVMEMNDGNQNRIASSLSRTIYIQDPQQMMAQSQLSVISNQLVPRQTQNGFSGTTSKIQGSPGQTFRGEGDRQIRGLGLEPTRS